MESRLWYVHAPVVDKNGMRAWVVGDKPHSEAAAFTTLGEMGFIASTLREEDAYKIAADHNLLLGIPAEAIEAAGLLQANLALFLIDYDQWEGERYVEEVFPKWLVDLAGGIDDLPVAKRAPPDEDL